MTQNSSMPWQLGKYEPVVQDAHGHLIAVLTPHPDVPIGQVNLDARLITCAPELRKTLRSMLVSYCGVGPACREGLHKDAWAVLGRIEAAD